VNETPAADPLLSRLSGIAVALAADVLDRLGFRSQVMSSAIRPIVPRERLVGRAFPVAATAGDVIPENPYEHELAAVDAVPPGGVIVLATGGFFEAAIWGELLTTRARVRGAVGAITDGAVRDLAQLREVDFPVFAAAVSANDSRGRVCVTGWGEPIVCAGVSVNADDYVLGDADGVVVVPEVVAANVIAAAEEKQAKEALARDLLAGGTPATDVWHEHGVL
jgi:regulator of RNase E activity RraA